MSAFLKYSQTRRAKVKEDNPDMSNTDVSRLLGEMWRNASPRERAPYVEQEEGERAVYKENIRKWRDDQARMDAASRTSHQTMQNYQHHQHPHHQHPHHPHPHHQHPQPPIAQPMERSYRPGIFESLPMDSFEEPAKKSTFGHQYSNPNPAYQPYRHPYNPSVGTYIKDKSIYLFV
jgi:transcription factor SOX1/3/14/21 (SOX group B)